MQDSIYKNNQAVAYKGLLVLLLLTLVIALLLLFVFSKVEAYSAFLGGLSYILPNYYFARFAFRLSSDATADEALKWLMIGEVLKLVLTGVAIAMCIKFISPLHMPAFMLVFAVVMMVNLIFLHKNLAN